MNEYCHLKNCTICACIYRTLSLSSSSSYPEWLNLDDIDIPLRQRHLSCAIDEAMYQNLLDTSPSTRARAWANSSALPHAGDWLNGVSSDVLGLLQDKEFNSCLKYWLGIPLHSAPHLCPACRTSADEYGDHLWRKWRQNHPPQCGQRCNFLSCSICSSRTIPRGPRFNPRIPVKTR